MSFASQVLTLKKEVRMSDKCEGCVFDDFGTCLNDDVCQREEPDSIKASDCKCCVCGAQAVAFWPFCDPDIPSYPYCRKCLDKAKAELLRQLLGIDTKYEKR